MSGLCLCDEEIYSFDVVYLPPANEVWGKVMFLHLSAILFTVERGIPHLGTPPQADPPRQTPPRHILPPSRQTPQGRIPPPETATEAGGTHPTGVHSCILLFLPPVKSIWLNFIGTYFSFHFSIKSGLLQEIITACRDCDAQWKCCQNSPNYPNCWIT